MVALIGVEAKGEVGTLGVSITNSAEGVGAEEPAKVEKILLAAPLLDDEKEDGLRAALSRVPGRVSFMAIDGDPVSIDDMEKLADIFQKSKWDVVGKRVGRFQEPIVDIIIQAASEDAAYAGFAQSALREAGIEAMGAIVPAVPRDQIEIMVGNTTAKPSTSRK